MHRCGVDARRGWRHARQTAGEPRARSRTFRSPVSAVHLQGGELHVQIQSLSHRCGKNLFSKILYATPCT